jgi:hypothetical protein
MFVAHSRLSILFCFYTFGCFGGNEERKSKAERIELLSKLFPNATDRCLRKLFDINDVGPYEVLAKQWYADFASLPPVSHGNLLKYLVFGVSQYSLQEFKANKMLEAYKQSVDGSVQEIYIHKPANYSNTFIAAKIRIMNPDNVI